MTTLFAILVAGTFLTGCFSAKEVQVEIINAQLIRIDTIYRYSNPQKQLTWMGSDKMEYVSVVDISEGYSIGTRMMVMKTK